MSKLASLGLLVALLSPTQPAQAVPHVYTDTVLGVSDLTACVENARKVASKNGFTDDIQVIGSEESRDVYANHASKPLALAISCSTRLGAASIGRRRHQQRRRLRGLQEGLRRLLSAV